LQCWFLCPLIVHDVQSPLRLKKRNTTQAANTAPYINQGKGATLLPGTVEPLHHEGKNNVNEDQERLCNLAYFSHTHQVLHLDTCFLLMHQVLSAHAPSAASIHMLSAHA
jgi:hypothetical protein